MDYSIINLDLIAFISFTIRKVLCTGSLTTRIHLINTAPLGCNSLQDKEVLKSRKSVDCYGCTHGPLRGV